MVLRCGRFVSCASWQLTSVLHSAKPQATAATAAVTQQQSGGHSSGRYCPGCTRLVITKFPCSQSCCEAAVGQRLVLDPGRDTAQDIWSGQQALMLRNAASMSPTAADEVLMLMASVAGRQHVSTEGSLRIMVEALMQPQSSPTAAGLELLRALACTGARHAAQLRTAAHAPHITLHELATVILRTGAPVHGTYFANILSTGAFMQIQLQPMTCS